MENIEKIAEMAFHGVTYIIKISSKDDVLSLEIEEKDSGNIWKNMFTATYIEEITTKTGNFKKYGVFVKMLLSSITKASDSVFLDILTSQDLEMLKARKQKTDGRASVNTEKSKNMKRYMILTYQVEYDKVHYPLPLIFEENPDVGALKNTIRRLRLEIEDMRTGQSKLVNQSGENLLSAGLGDNQADKAELTALKVENEALKEKVKRFEDAGINSATTKKLGAVENDNVLKSKLELEEELANLKKDYVRDIKRLKAKLEETEVAFEKTKEELSHSKNGQAAGLGDSKGQRTKEDEFEISTLKKTMARYQKEIEGLNQELDTLRNADRKQKTRIKQLETELESALKRASYSRGSNVSGGSLYSRSRENSPNNSVTKSFRNTGGKTTPTNRGTPTNTRGTPTNTRGTPTNTRGTPSRTSPGGTPTRSNLYGSGSKTYGLSGSNLRQPRGNSPGSRPGNLSTNTSNSSTGTLNRKPTPQRTNQRDTFGLKKTSPQPSRNLSPANKPNNYSPSPQRLSPGGNRFGMRYNNYMPNNNAQKNLSNSLRNKSGNMSDSEDELAQSRRQQGGKGPSVSTTNTRSYANPIGNNRNAGNYNTVQQDKLKENIQDFKESQNNRAPERIENNPLEQSVETADISDRLNKLQDLLRKAKS